MLICIVNFLIFGLEHGQASVVIPNANMSLLVAMLTSLALKTERLDDRKAVAVWLELFSIYMLYRA